MSSSCKTCDGNVTSLVSLHANNTQKSILRQNRVRQSLYIQNVASLNNTIMQMKVKNMIRISVIY